MGLISSYNPSNFGGFYEGFIPSLFYIHTNQLIMFIQPSNLQSSAVRNIRLNPATNQVIVQFLTSAKTYLYDGVCTNCIANFLFGELTPGEFVNTFKGDIKPLVVG